MHIRITMELSLSDKQLSLCKTPYRYRYSFPWPIEETDPEEDICADTIPELRAKIRRRLILDYGFLIEDLPATGGTPHEE